MLGHRHTPAGVTPVATSASHPSAPSARNRTASPTIGSASPRDHTPTTTHASRYSHFRREFTDEYFAHAEPDPAHFGMSAEDDGSRDDPLLSDRSWAVSSYRPDVAAIAAAPTRIVIAVGEESLDTFTGRTAVATAELLRQRATVFPSHHGGFLGGEFGYAGQPEAFARKLREVLDDDN
jgi:hypothetical protein